MYIAIAIIQAVTCGFNFLSCPSLPVYLRILRYTFPADHLLQIDKFVSARSIFWCNVDVEWRWQGSWASNGAMAPLCQPTLIFTYLPFFAHFLGHLDVKTVDDAYQDVKEKSTRIYRDVSRYMRAQDAKLDIRHYSLCCSKLQAKAKELEM